jgi:APA family basic amino acid/polyamine antiporter
MVGLVIVAAWLVYFYGANLTAPWFGKFSVDSSELPIITIYGLYIPMFVQFIRKEKSLPVLKRIVLPVLGIIGSGFMVVAALYSHGYVPYITAKEAGQGFSCPVLFYLIVFAVIMAIGMLLMNPQKKEKTK